MTRVAAKPRAAAKPRVAHFPVSESNVRKAAIRVLGQQLVSPEVQYVQRTLGNTASQQEMDETILAVRKLPWASIVSPDSL
jgi:hypothetical protein